METIHCHGLRPSAALLLHHMDDASALGYSLPRNSHVACAMAAGSKHSELAWERNNRFNRRFYWQAATQTWRTADHPPRVAGQSTGTCQADASDRNRVQRGTSRRRPLRVARRECRPGGRSIRAVTASAIGASSSLARQPVLRRSTTMHGICSPSNRFSVSRPVCGATPKSYTLVASIAAVLRYLYETQPKGSCDCA